MERIIQVSVYLLATSTLVTSFKHPIKHQHYSQLINNGLSMPVPSLSRASPDRKSNFNIFTVDTKHDIALKEPIPIVEGFGVGLWRDIKAKAPFYLSDFTDGFRIKTLSSTFFLFFACLAPAIAFGGLLSIATGGMMGTMEAVGATALGGILYALFAGQPITIIGTTGPLLAFLKVLYEACKAHSISFLPLYAWVGIWSSLFLYLSAFFSTSNVVEYFTKFTDDIFSSLISVIFIFEACKELILNFCKPSMSGIQATSSLMIALTTFVVARTLSSLRKTIYFPKKLRNIIADFAPTIGVLSGISVAKGLMSRYVFSLPMLAVPSLLGTTSGRSWFVDIWSLPHRLKILAILPAIMATVLLFMDQNITVRLIMSKKNKLQKGNGIHLDMLIVALVTTITSLLGMPWMVAATVRSLAHLRSLTEYETAGIKSETAGTITETTEKSVNGSGEVKVSGALEQRLSGLLIHCLIGGSVLFGRPLLRQIPVSVLTGLFLYLGISSIGTTELYDRSKLFISDSNEVAKTSPWRLGGIGGTTAMEGLKKTKCFTAIQLTLLGGMWWMKETKLGVFFPVLIGLLAPVRIALEKMKVFKKEELEVLDGEIE